MNLGTFNEILAFEGLDVVVEREFLKSGQRTVYFGKNSTTQKPIVVKYCLYNELRIARIQREINILNKLSSEFFPRVHKHTFISNEILSNFIDSFDIRENYEKVLSIKTSRIKPFFVSVEEFIENIGWSSITGNMNKQFLVVDILIDCFTALGLLWDAQIVHRDLKPDNILIRPNFKPVIIDLGTAKSLKDGTKNITRANMLPPCTPKYAAPEQLIPGTDISYKADQFSMGVVAFEALSSELPFGDVNDIDEDGLITNFQQGKVSNLTDVYSDVNKSLAKFIHRLLEVEPYKRFRNVESILAILNEIKGELT